MRMEKELVMKEYLFLKETNKQLKEQMSKMIKCEVKETPLDRDSTRVETTSLIFNPLVVYHTPPFPELMWPSFAQSLNSVHARSQTMDPFDEQGVAGVTNCPRSTIFVPQNPLFFPVIHHLPGSSHSSVFCALTNREEVPTEKGENPEDWKLDLRLSSCTDSSNEKISLHIRRRGGAPRTMEAISRKGKDVVVDDAKMLTGFCAHGTQISDQHSTPGTVEPFLNVKSEPGVSHRVGTISENLEGLCIYPQKKLGDASAAAGARKRRKELTTLKNLHG